MPEFLNRNKSYNKRNMYHSTSRLLLATGFLLLSFTLVSQSYRYTNTVFPSSDKIADVTYGTAPFLNFPYYNESNTTVDDLVMDVYTPTGDANVNRPAIIFAHSGGFIVGDRNHDDMVAFCDSFARKGYVTATIDYRQGFNVLSDAPIHGTRAVYRGLQDGRAAVRFMRANAATYGVDPDKVYLAGSSAGSFIALHSVYMDTPAEKPAVAGTVSYSNLFFPFFYSGPDLGGYDVGDNLGFNGTPDVIISLWGALEDADLITSDNNKPVYLAHGMDDTSVSFNAASPFQVATFPEVEGSNLINNKLELLGLTNKETYFVAGEGHEFHGTSNGDWVNGIGGNAYWDIILEQTTNFLWLQHKPTANFNYSASGLTLDYTDSSSGAISWLWDFGDGTTSTLENPTHTYAEDGNYQAFLYIENDILSWDTISYPIEVAAPLPVVWTAPVNAFYERGQTTISWSVAQQVNNEKFIVEHSLDARRFSSIAEIRGEGDFNDEMSYTHFHKNPPLGLNYYRISQIDYDGTLTYSEVVSVQVEDQRKSIVIYPNPSSGAVTVAFELGEPEAIKIYNAVGKLVKLYPAPPAVARLELSELASGLYFVRTGSSTEVQTLVLRR